MPRERSGNVAYGVKKGHKTTPIVAPREAVS